MKIAVAVLAAALLCGCASPPGRFEFALIGDQQYDAESEAQFPRLMADLDRAEVEFVVHLGDFKPGTTLPCDDKLLQSRRQQFDGSRHPFIYTPGDNQWTDCHNPKAGGFVPEERLAALRRIFFAEKKVSGSASSIWSSSRIFPRTCAGAAAASCS